MTDYEKFSAILRLVPETGQLFWKQNKPGRQTQHEAGHCDGTGYRRIMLDYKMYLAHRIVWLLTHGEWPSKHLDHIDGNPRNNRIENLRDVSRSENLLNNHRRRNGTLSRRTVRQAIRGGI